MLHKGSKVFHKYPILKRLGLRCLQSVSCSKAVILWVLPNLLYVAKQARRFVEIIGGVQLNNQNFFGEI